MVESASINKSLFTLAKCVEAISSNSARIPYRESKMTRILSLGQNNGLTVMVLNLAPVRSYHLDTLSSLNFANRTKKIEVREIENEPIFKGCSRAIPTFTGKDIQRQPLRPLAQTVHNSTTNTANAPHKPGDKQAKSFSVYSDRARQSNATIRPARTDASRFTSPRKRPSDPFSSSASRPQKRRSPPRVVSRSEPTMSKEALESIIEKKVNDVLAARALDQPSIAPQPEISEEVQRRLDMLEQRIDGKNDGREQGLTFLLMAKQHVVRGEDASALRMYTLAKDFFPDNQKLDVKIQKLRQSIQEKKDAKGRDMSGPDASHPPLGRNQCEMKALTEGGIDIKVPGAGSADAPHASSNIKSQHTRDDDGDYQGEEEYKSDGDFHYKPRTKKARPRTVPSSEVALENEDMQTPRTKELLRIVNTRDLRRIRLLKGVGAKKAETIIEALCAGDEDDENLKGVSSLGELGRLPGVGVKTVENMRIGL